MGDCLLEFAAEVGASIAILLFILYIAGPKAFRYFADKDLQRIKHEQEKELERLRSISEKEFFTYRLQFEKEFKAYDDLWRELVNLHRAVSSLRPVKDHRDPKQSVQERMNQRLNKFYTALVTFTDSVDYNRPFFAPNVFDAAARLRNLCCSEAEDYEMHPCDSAPGCWKDQKENVRRIQDMSDDICNTIRERVVSRNETQSMI